MSVKDNDGLVIFFFIIGAISVYNYHPFDKCREYSAHTCEQIDKANYNAYFYYPDGNEVFLGKMAGLSSCQWIAEDFAERNGIQRPEWSYICCMATEKSECEEKHR